MESTDRLEQLFRAAQLLPLDQRQTFLRAACGDDADLLRELDSLLAAYEDADAEGFLDVPAAELLDDPFIGREVGPYTIRRALGSGGMGDVYLALQERPFKRYVAIKLIRPGLDTKQVLRRFEAERQILASLSHPNIARLLDGGITSDGLPYFAMEYVEGMPLLTYCDTHRLGLDDRLRLFQTVCHTVHYAHQNLVLHRDIKPSNILVTTEGTVKLLDFGVAKLLNPNLSNAAMPDTRTEMRMMTPEYASPEQVRGLTLTTASDVYSLGVVLYELLTGRKPYLFSARTNDEILRIVCHEEAPRPSTRVAQIEAHDAVAISESRGLTPDRMRRSLRGDLDNVVMTALRKEPGRRYASAEQFSEDIERYLSEQPVAARPNTFSYRVRKFTSRHRGPVVAAALVILSLIVGLGTALRMANVASHERQVAQKAEAQARSVSELLIGLFESSDPWQRPEDALWADALLARGIDQANALDADPVVQARFLDAIGRVYEHLGRYEEAQAQLERALAIRTQTLGEDDPAVAEVMNHLGWVQYRRGRYAEAEKLYRRALDIQRAALGDDNPALGTTYTNLGYIPHPVLDTSLSFFRRGLEIRSRTLGSDHPDVATSMGLIGIMLSRKGQDAEAEGYLRRVVDIRRRQSDTDAGSLAKAYFNLADHLARHSSSDSEIERLYREGLALLERSFGHDHLGRAHGLSNLADLLDRQGRFDEAEDLYRESLALRTRIFGENHTTVPEAMTHLAVHLQRRGQLAEAESLSRNALEMFRKNLGLRHRSVAWSMQHLAAVLATARKFDEAESFGREAVSIRMEVGGPDDLSVADALGLLARVYQMMGDFEHAEENRLRSLQIMKKQLPDDHILVQEAYAEMVSLYNAWQRPDDAERYQALLSSARET